MEGVDFETLVFMYKSESGQADFLFCLFMLFSPYIFLKMKL